MTKIDGKTALLDEKFVISGNTRIRVQNAL